MKKDILVIGAGGHARTILSILSYYENFNVIGIVDRNRDFFGETIGSSIIKHEYNDLKNLKRKGIENAVIAIGDNVERRSLFDILVKIGFKLPNFIHPNSFLEKSVKMGYGNVICMSANIGSFVKIGNNCIIYGGTIEHESILKSNVFIAPSVSLAGRVTIGNSCYIGIGSSIIEKIIVGNFATVGAGAVVLDDVSENITVAGNPAKVIRNRVK